MCVHKAHANDSDNFGMSACCTNIRRVRNFGIDLRLISVLVSAVFSLASLAQQSADLNECNRMKRRGFFSALGSIFIYRFELNTIVRCLNFQLKPIDDFPVAIFLFSFFFGSGLLSPIRKT